MTAFTVLGAPLVAVGAKPFATTIQALRDNAVAVAEGDLTAPVNAACWHPYDMVMANDGAIGRFYNGTAVASVAVPTMVAGYDYLFKGLALSHNNGAAQTFLINGVDAFGALTFTNAQTLNFSFEVLAPAIANLPKFANSGVRFRSGGADNAAFTTGAVFTNTQAAITTFNFTWSAGSFDAGQLFLYKRRNYMS